MTGALAVLALAAPLQASATLIYLGANINGAQETPAVATPGHGVAAGVQIPIPHTNGVTRDTLVGSAILTATQKTQLLSGLWYIQRPLDLQAGW